MRTDERTDRQTDRRPDMTKLIVAFRNFANALKNESKTKGNNKLNRKYGKTDRTLRTALLNGYYAA
jgi:hypothetical protein